MAAGPPTGKGTIGLTPSLARGVVIGVRSKAEFPAAATVLGNALMRMGFEASLEEVSARVPDAKTMLILVGPKQ